MKLHCLILCNSYLAKLTELRYNFNRGNIMHINAIRIRQFLFLLPLLTQVCYGDKLPSALLNRSIMRHCIISICQCVYDVIIVLKVQS